jgi:hypothetical protein
MTGVRITLWQVVVGHDLSPLSTTSSVSTKALHPLPSISFQLQRKKAPKRRLQNRDRKEMASMTCFTLARAVEYLIAAQDS